MAGGAWMPSKSQTHVGSLASGFGQATGLDSPVSVSLLYLLAAAFDVKPRLEPSTHLSRSLPSMPR